MSALLTKLDRLLALAASPNDHEARNAAMLACRLIRENKLVITEPGGTSADNGRVDAAWVNDLYAAVRGAGERAPPRRVVDEVRREGAKEPANLDELLRKGAEVLEGVIPKGRK